MTAPEKRWLLVGVFVGALIAGAVGTGLFYRNQRKQLPVVETPTQPAASEPTQIAAQLSGRTRRGEQRWVYIISKYVTGCCRRYIGQEL